MITPPSSKSATRPLRRRSSTAPWNAWSRPLVIANVISSAGVLSSPSSAITSASVQRGPLSPQFAFVGGELNFDPVNPQSPSFVPSRYGLHSLGLPFGGDH